MTQNPVDLLLVEDNGNDAELTIRVLKKYCRVTNLVHLKDGEEALEFIFSTGKYAAVRDISILPKVILLDIQMPKVNGIEVLQRIKSDNRTKAIPVVILTSSNQDPDMERCYELGANSYIVKPVGYEGFSEAIRAVGLYWILINKPLT